MSSLSCLDHIRSTKTLRSHFDRECQWPNSFSLSYLQQCQQIFYSKEDLGIKAIEKKMHLIHGCYFIFLNLHFSPQLERLNWESNCGIWQSYTSEWVKITHWGRIWDIQLIGVCLFLGFALNRLGFFLISGPRQLNQLSMLHHVVDKLYSYKTNAQILPPL